MEKLGFYRNRIMHLGIDVNADFADLLAVLHESFKIIIDDSFYRNLIELSDYFSYNDAVDMIEPWQECSSDVLRLLSTTIEKRKLIIFDKMIESVLKSNQFTNFLNSNGIVFENESIYQDNVIDLEFACNRKQIKFTTDYDAFYNYTAILTTTYCDKLVFCVKHFDNEIVIGERWIEYDDFVLDDIYNQKMKEAF